MLGSNSTRIAAQGSWTWNSCPFFPCFCMTAGRVAGHVGDILLVSLQAAGSVIWINHNVNRQANLNWQAASSGHVFSSELGARLCSCWSKELKEVFHEKPQIDFDAVPGLLTDTPSELERRQDSEKICDIGNTPNAWWTGHRPNCKSKTAIQIYTNARSLNNLCCLSDWKHSTVALKKGGRYWLLNMHSCVLNVEVGRCIWSSKGNAVLCWKHPHAIARLAKMYYEGLATLVDSTSKACAQHTRFNETDHRHRPKNRSNIQ